MINKLCLPSLGENIDQAIILSWLKKVGDLVASGEAILEITVDKITFEVESPFTGTLLQIYAENGDLVPCEAILAIIGEETATIPAELSVIKYPKASFDSYLRFQKSGENPKETGTPIKLNAMRTVISDRMVRSKYQAPHFYLQTRVDMSACFALRQRIRKEENWRLSYNNMLIKACGLALRKYPQVAAIYDDGQCVMREHMNVGFAVALPPDGLVVPVVRDVDKLPIKELCAQTKDLVDKANNKHLLPHDFTGGVLTVSNLGGMGVDFFTAIINPGESAILAIGDIIETPVVVKGEITIHPMMSITISSDHRTVDGLLAAQFCGEIKKLLEKPEHLLESPAE